ncbi:MAG: hypothetical protein J6P97_04965 [Bacteroidales bacterium]|nr:hypothetical protein [Bacteroidales bacterium]
MKTTLMQRSELYKSKPVKNSAKGGVPKEKDAKAKDERAKILAKWIKNKEVLFCPALSANVYTKRKSKEETIYHASKSHKSTIVAMNMSNLYADAKYSSYKPKANKNQICFKNIHVLIAVVKGVGYAKITVGEFYEDVKGELFCQYCATHISLRKIKK